MRSSRLPPVVVRLGFAVVATLAAMVYGYAMHPWGPWALTDSAAYVDAARSIAAGQGVFIHTTKGGHVLLVHHPPGYPALLALGMRLTAGQWVAAARGIDLLALWLTLMVVGEWTFDATHDAAFSTLAMLALAVAPFTAHAFTGVMSEAPFIALMVGWLYLLWRAWHVQREMYFWLAVLLAGMDVLIRYAGLHAAIVLVVGALLIPPKTSWRGRARRAALALALFLGPFGLWMGYAAWMGRRSPGGFTPPTTWASAGASFLHQTAQTFLQTLLPMGGAPSPWLTGAFWLGVFALGWLTWQAWRKTTKPSRPAVFLICLAVLDGWAWFVFLAFMYIFIAPAPALNARMYTPAMLMWVLAGLGAMWQVGSRWAQERRTVAWAILGGCLLLVTAKAPHQPTRAWLYRLHRVGSGYTQQAWHQMAAPGGVLHAVTQLPPATPIFSNAWEGTLLWTGRAVQPIDYHQWQTAAAQARLTTAPKFEHWQQSQGALLLIWVAQHNQGQAILMQSLRHSGAFLCYDDGLGSLYFPHPTEVCPAQ